MGPIYVYKYLAMGTLFNMVPKNTGHFIFHGCEVAGRSCMAANRGVGSVLR